MPAPNAGQPWLLSSEDSAGGEPTSAPAWIDPAQRVLTAITKRFAILFEKEFDPQIAIDLSIPTVAKDDRPRIAELAARCLATTERYTDLIALLATSPHVEVRSAAAAGLRSWMIQDDARVAILKQELANRYSNEDWLPVSRLLLGFNQADARDRLTSVMLVEWLRSPYIEVRELAIDQIETLAGKRHDFKPSASAPVRESGIIRWMNHIDREGALLRPE